MPSVDPVSGGIVRLLVDSAKAGNANNGPGQGSLDTRPMQNFFREVVAMASQDYDNVRSGAYGLPWDMATPGHRQYDPAFVLRRSAQFLFDGVATLGRQARGAPDPVWLQGPGLYPHYYTKTFHYQTDGWLSDRSARSYEHATEVIFFGHQDAMQRMTLLPIADYIKEQAQSHGRPPSRLRLLEVAAGTGRFHTFLKDTWPELPSVVSDLSPFYLAAARENLGYWRRTRQRGRQLGGVDGTGCEFLQAAAEDVPRPDGSFDVLVVMNLFHELPEVIRRRAASEFFRLLAPGGLLVLTDSVQSGDRLKLDTVLPAFGDFNEPYYRNYFNCDLGALFSGVGFLPDTKYLASATKTLSFRTPASA